MIQLSILNAVALALAFPLTLQASLSCAIYLHVKEEMSG